MRYNTDLYKLIKSLTKSEKRYFKIYAAQQTKNESNNYILLFDAIERQEVFNEEKLKRKFRNHTFGKNLAKTKYLLYELIIKMLVRLKQGKDIDSKIRLLLDAVEFHYSKSLYNQALVSLQKAKKLAKFFEHYGYWIEALKWEIKLAKYSKNSNASSLQLINKEYKSIKELLSHELNITALFQEVQLLAESAFSNPMNEHIFELDILFENRLITKNQAKTFLTKLYRQEILVLQALVAKNFELALSYLEEIYDMWEEHVEKIAIFPHDFIRFCKAYMSCSTSARKKGIYYDELLERFLEMRKVCAVDSDKIFFQASMFDFIFNLVNDNLEVCAIQLFTIKDLIAKHIDKLNLTDTINLYYHISVYYFLKGEYRETLNWIGKIQKLETKNELPNLKGYCHLLSLVSKYEEQEFDVLESDLMKAHQFLKSRKIMQPIENLILGYIEKLINTKHRSEELSLLTQLLNSLQNLSDGNLAYKITANNAICSWVKEKISKKHTPLFN